MAFWIPRPTARLLLASALVLGMASQAFFSLALGQPGSAPDWRQPCLTPIKYRIGKLDPRFGITREDFQHHVEEAAELWGAAAGRKLFSLDDKGRLEIDLVYDTRQEVTQRMAAVRASIADKLKDADQIKGKMAPLQSRLRDLQDAYSGQLSAYQRALDAYNKAVLDANHRGGAPPEEHDRLAGEARLLHKQEASLIARQREVNNLVGDINDLIRAHNAILDRANAEADALNKSMPVGIQFEQGRYFRQPREERIDIYEYDGESALVVILAHEMGHALGIRHNGDPASIMSPLVHVKMPVLTAADLEGLKTACSLQ